METEAEHKIEFTINESDFAQVFGRMPENRGEFKKFAELCEKGLRQGHINWDMLFECAKEAMK